MSRSDDNATSDEDSTVRKLKALRNGDETAAADLWDSYYERMTAVALQKFGKVSRRMIDEEDVAASAFAAFCRRIKAGNITLNNNAELWGFLSRITRDKVVDVIRYHTALRRGGGAVRGDSVFIEPDDGFDVVPADQPLPEEQVAIEELHREVLAQLPGDDFRLVATRRIEGLTNLQIAHELGISERSIERKMQIIREVWNRV